MINETAIEKAGWWVVELGMLEDSDFEREARRFFRFGKQRFLDARELAQARDRYDALLRWSL